MERETRRLHIQKYGSLAVAVLGLVLTVLVLQPGVYTAELGPLQFDGYYSAVYGFAFLLFYGLYQVYTFEER